MGSYFSVPIFFIMFRETLEASIIVSVLLSFLAQVIVDDAALHRRLKWHVWVGVIVGLVISLAIGGAVIAVWNSLAKNIFGSHEALWEGAFGLIACVMITIMALAMLKSQDMQEKWRGKLAQSMENTEVNKGFSNYSRKYALLILPLVTVLREGLEAMIFVGGVTFSEQTRAIPLAAILGIIAGALVGYIIYRGGNRMTLHRFFVASTCFLLVIAAGLFSRSIASFETNRWMVLTNAASDDGPSFDPRVNVWNLSWGNPKDTAYPGWQLLNAIFGWNNVASYGTIIGYCLYWVAVITALVVMKIKQRKARAAGAEEVVESDFKEEKTEVN